MAESLGRGIGISDNMFLSDDKSIARRIMSDLTVDTIGRMEADFLLESPLFIHGKWMVEKPVEDIDPLPMLNIKMRKIYSFYDGLWTLRDNCVNSETVFLIEREGGRDERVSVNGMAYRYDCADSKIVDVSFTRSEIQDTRDKYSARISALEESRITPELEVKMAGQSGRIGRAFKFLFATRTSSSTLLKVAYQCSFLEAMFCTDSGEISHKIAERAAVFLGSDMEERARVYRFLKKAYSVRSRVIHGGAISGDVEGLVGTCVELDGILRRIMNRVLSNTEEWDLFMKTERDAFDEHFLKRLLS
ncbi:MAG: hypothetical protein ABL955_01525 [Elusimicrobiota bacterium]